MFYRLGEEHLDTQLAAKDKRIKLMSQILSGIKVMKQILSGIKVMKQILSGIKVIKQILSSIKVICKYDQFMLKGL